MDALAYVHDHDMLHRDISPANIMVDARGKPWLIDFGAFKEMWKDQPRRTTMQAANPAYAAPEQLDEMAGQGHGPFTDIFALSATLYEAIAGRKPSSAMSRTVSLVSGRADSLEPLGQVAAISCHPAVVATVTRGLSLSPSARPQSIAEMRQEMDWTKGATTVAWREPPRPARAPPPMTAGRPPADVEDIIRTSLQLNPGLGLGRPLSPPTPKREERHRSRTGLVAGLLAGVAVAGLIGALVY